MVDVPAGSFWMGCAKGDPECRDDEKPRHKVTLSAFQIDRLEVTVEQYRTCLRVGACKAKDAGQVHGFGGKDLTKKCNFNITGRGRHGMNCVDGEDALEYCKWLGKRFPTEAEWERAARGTDDRIYPWGDEPPSPARMCMPIGASCPVGSFPDGASPTGALDMGGNLAEWVGDTYFERYYSRSPTMNPQGPEPFTISQVHYGCGTMFCEAVRGRTARVSERWGIEDWRMVEVGFRCARDASQQPSVAP
jgi:formylglycine-generating enzyme required for sulfatase activity